MTDDISRKMQSGASGTAIVVDVVDGDLGHAKLIEDALSAGRVSVAVASYSLVNIVVVYLCIEEGFDAGFIAKLSVVYFSTRLDEFGHSHAEHIARFIFSDDHCCGCD